MEMSTAKCLEWPEWLKCTSRKGRWRGVGKGKVGTGWVGEKRWEMGNESVEDALSQGDMWRRWRSLKGLNKVFISGIGGGKSNAMQTVDTLSPGKIGRGSGKCRGVGRVGVPKPGKHFPKPKTRRGSTWNVLNATLRVTFAECECHFACTSAMPRPRFPALSPPAFPPFPALA